MNKIQFMLELHDKLSGLPKEDVEERLNFYIEMIEDRMEEGLSEEEAVAAIGTTDEIVAQILEDIPLTKIAKEKIKIKRQLKVWEIICLILGSPIWLSLLIALLAILLSIYVSVWAVVISFWAAFGSVIASGFAGILAGIGFACGGKALIGMAVIGAGIICIGLSIFLFYGCMAATKGTVWLTKKSVLGIKKYFVKKEEA